MNVIALDREVPETWLLGPAVAALRRGDLVVVPTDSVYAIACDPWSPQAVTKLTSAKGLDDAKRCSVLCQDLRDVNAVARAVSDGAFRFLRRHLPGPYTILLHASRDLPKRAIGRRREIGVRMPDHLVSLALTAEFGGPLLVTSLPVADLEEPIDPVTASEALPIRPAVVLDQGPQVAEPTTVVDFSADPPELVRQGKGPVYLMD